jgi:hypothetical protein
MTRLTASFTLPMQCENVWPLFTARGERTWVAGWDPDFPGELNDQAVGTVFTTSQAGVVTTWIVTTADPGHQVGYARVTPHETAGTVGVTCRPRSRWVTEVTVVYQLTALTPDADARLHAFAENYPDYIHSWRDAILRARIPSSDSS